MLQRATQAVNPIEQRTSPQLGDVETDAKRDTIASMSGVSDTRLFVIKATESLDGAESEFANRRFDNCANRAYYACYQAAVAALIREGIRSPGRRWGHDTVQALFVGELINRRKRYPPDLRDTFERLFLIRQTADYSSDFVSEIQAARALRRARAFVQATRDSES